MNAPQHGQPPEGEASELDGPAAHGKFSLSEDWTATIAGLIILVLALLGVVPDISGWFE